MQYLKKASVSLIIASLVITSPCVSSSYNHLPDIGTAAASTLTVDKEIEYGRAYMQVLRSRQPIVNDPVLNEYVARLGNRLLAHASDVKTPFEFFLVENKYINAFAFFGGYVALHTGLFYYAKNESELASVIAHEIAHLTQRHLARSMEDQARKTPLTIAALVGSLMLAVASPQAGVAAAQATTAASMQGRINYTRDNEKEADRIGIDNLNRAGFDVHAMPRFFSRLSDQYRYASKPPAFLLTHPLPDDRITDSRQRAQQFKTKPTAFSLDFDLAKARVVARFLNMSSKNAMAWFENQAKQEGAISQQAIRYGKALVHIKLREFDKADALLTPLYQRHPDNRFYLDAMTDLNIEQKKAKTAIERLEKALLVQPNNRVLLINLGYAFVKAKMYPQAISQLIKYTYKHPEDINAWSLLHQSYVNTGNKHAALAAQGELYALKGYWQKAIQNFIQAGQLVKLGSFDQARYDARIDQLRINEARSATLKR